MIEATCKCGRNIVAAHQFQVFDWVFVLIAGGIGFARCGVDFFAGEFEDVGE